MIGIMPLGIIMETWLVGLEVVACGGLGQSFLWNPPHIQHLSWMVTNDFLLEWQLTLNLNLGIPIEFGHKRMIHLWWFKLNLQGCWTCCGLTKPLKHKPYNMNLGMVKTLAHRKTFHMANKLRHTMNTIRWFIGHQPNLTITISNGASW